MLYDMDADKSQFWLITDLIIIIRFNQQSAIKLKTNTVPECIPACNIGWKLYTPLFTLSMQTVFNICTQV